MVPPQLSRRGAAAVRGAGRASRRSTRRRRSMTYVHSIDGRARCSTSTRSPAPPACTPSWSAGSSRSGCSTPQRDAARPPVVPAAPSSPRSARIQRLRAGLCAQLRRARPGPRPARPHRRAGGRAAQHRPRRDRRLDVDLNRLTQKSQEALHDAQTKALRFGHTEVDGEHLLLALLDQPDGLVPRLLLAGRRRPEPAAARTGARAARRPRVSGPGAAARPGLRHPAAGPAAGRRRARGQAAQGRVRLGRAPAARSGRRGHEHRRRPAAARARG